MVILTTLEEKKKYVQQFNVFDDSFFEMVAKDKEAVEDILRIPSKTYMVDRYGWMLFALPGTEETSM